MFHSSLLCKHPTPFGACNESVEGQGLDEKMAKKSVIAKFASHWLEAHQGTPMSYKKNKIFARYHFSMVRVKTGDLASL